MSAALCALHESVKQDPLPYKNLIPSFISILKQAATLLAVPPCAHCVLSMQCPAVFVEGLRNSRIGNEC